MTCPHPLLNENTREDVTFRHKHKHNGDILTGMKYTTSVKLCHFMGHVVMFVSTELFIVLYIIRQYKSPFSWPQPASLSLQHPPLLFPPARAGNDTRHFPVSLNLLTSGKLVSNSKTHAFNCLQYAFYLVILK